MCHKTKERRKVEPVENENESKSISIYSKEIKTSFPVHLLLCCDTNIINEILINLNEKK